jgi:hypothetical protein
MVAAPSSGWASRHKLARRGFRHPAGQRLDGGAGAGPLTRMTATPARPAPEDRL